MPSFLKFQLWKRLFSSCEYNLQERGFSAVVLDGRRVQQSEGAVMLPPDCIFFSRTQNMAKPKLIIVVFCTMVNLILCFFVLLYPKFEKYIYILWKI